MQVVLLKQEGKGIKMSLLKKTKKKIKKGVNKVKRKILRTTPTYKIGKIIAKTFLKDKVIDAAVKKGSVDSTRTLMKSQRKLNKLNKVK